MIKKWTSEYGKAFLIFLLIPMILLWKVVFLGYILSPSDQLMELPHFNSMAPKGFKASNSLLSDQSYYLQPWTAVASRAIERREIPLWNPYVSCGMPLLANHISAVLFPPNLLLFWFLPWQKIFGCVAIIKLFLAGTGTYMFLKRMGLKKSSSLMGGITFMLCGFNVVWLGNPQSNVSIFLPWLFFSTELLVKNRSYGLILLSLIIGLQFLGGHGETSLHIISFTFLYLIYRSFSLGGVNLLKTCVPTFLLSLILGLLLASPQLFPFLEYLRQSFHLSFRQQLPANPWYLPSFTSLCLIIPNILGNPVDHNYWAYSFGILHLNYNEQMGYVGILPLTLALLALTHANKIRYVFFFSFLGLLSLGVAYHWPPFFWLNKIPFFSIAANHRLLLIYQFSISILGSWGLEILQREDMVVRFRRFFWVELLSFLLFFSSLIYIMGKIPEGLMSYAWKNIYFFFFFFSLSQIFIWTLGRAKQRSRGAEEKRGKGEKGQGRNHFPFSLAPPLLCSSALFLVVIDIFLVYALGYNPSIEKRWVYPPFQGFQEVSKKDGIFRSEILMEKGKEPYVELDFRKYGMDERFKLHMFGNIGMVYGLSTTIGQDVLWIERFYQFREYMLRQKGLEHLYKILNVRYVILPDRVLEIKDCLPRYYLVEKAKVIKRGERILEELKGSDMISYLILEEEIPEKYQNLKYREKDSLPKELGNVQIVSYSLNEVNLYVDMEETGFLYGTETLYPGWQVYLDGEKGKIYRANYTFRAVILEKGRHKVRFVFNPPLYRLGLFLSLSVLVGLALFLFRKK